MKGEISFCHLWVLWYEIKKAFFKGKKFKSIIFQIKTRLFIELKYKSNK